ncbi:MAG: SDR family NAD(P)-dependent oxidoreductase [Gemmatimonadaceae bacterium]
METKVVVVTGASAGIGAALAEELGRRNANLVLVARRADALQAVGARINGNMLTVVGDMTRRADVEHVLHAAIERFGHVDVWINNAGQGITRPPSELTDDDVDEMVRANVKSALYGMQITLPHFKARGTGHVINISSMLGRMPFAVFRSAYSGSKHFLNALTANFRSEVQQTHPEIQYSIVSPGVVRTMFGLNARHGGPDSRALPESQSAEEVAHVIADVVDSRRPDVYSRPGARDRVAAFYAALGEDP